MVSCSVTTAIFAILLVTAYSQRRPAQRRPVAAAKPQAAVAFTAYDFDPSNVKLANIQKKAVSFISGFTLIHYRLLILTLYSLMEQPHFISFPILVIFPIFAK